MTSGTRVRNDRGRGVQVVRDRLLEGLTDLGKGGVEHLCIGLVSDPSKTVSAGLLRWRDVGDSRSARSKGNFAGGESSDAELRDPSREAVALTVGRAEDKGIFSPVNKGVMLC